jgi:hypothetical protein
LKLDTFSTPVVTQARLDRLAQLAAPLHPDDRDPLIRSAILMLSQERDPGPGTVNRIVCSLLDTNLYRRDAVAAAGHRHGRPRKHREDNDAA